MLFETRIDPRCAYCVRGEALDDTQVLCLKKGVVNASHHCRRFQYDPLKRIPPRPAPMRTDVLRDEDFSL